MKDGEHPLTLIPKFLPNFAKPRLPFNPFLWNLCEMSFSVFKWRLFGLYAFRALHKICINSSTLEGLPTHPKSSDVHRFLSSKTTSSQAAASLFQLKFEVTAGFLSVRLSTFHSTCPHNNTKKIC